MRVLTLICIFCVLNFCSGCKSRDELKKTPDHKKDFADHFMESVYRMDDKVNWPNTHERRSKIRPWDEAEAYKTEEEPEDEDSIFPKFRIKYPEKPAEKQY